MVKPSEEPLRTVQEVEISDVSKKQVAYQVMRIEKETDLWYNIDKKLTIRGKKRGENYASFSNPGLPFETVDV